MTASRLLLDVTDATRLLELVILAASLARTLISPPATTPAPTEFSITALALLLTLLLASRPPAAMPLAPNLALTINSLSAVVRCSLPTVAVTAAFDAALTDTAPPAVTLDPATRAVVAAGCSFVSRLSPTRASMAWNRILAGCQPTVLKATTTPTVSVLEAERVSEVAVIVAVFWASSDTAPAAVMSLLPMAAVALASTILLTSTPPAFCVCASTTLESSALMLACS